MNEEFAEELYLLYKSSANVLNSLYTCSKISVSTKYRPSFLSKKSVDPILKKVSTKFPNIIEIANKTNCSEFSKLNAEIIETTQPFYNSCVDLFNFKEAFTSVVRHFTANSRVEVIAHSQVAIYLVESLCALVRALLILNTIEDLVKIIGSYGLAFYLLNSTQDFSYLNICKMISSYAEPYKKLGEEFVAIYRIIESINSGIVDEFRLNCLDGKQMQTTYYYNLTASTKTMAVPSHFHIPEFQICSYNTFYRWIIYSTLVFPNLLTNPTIESAIYLLLSSNTALPLHRDMFIIPHKDLIGAIEGNKLLSKKSKDINEGMNVANSTFATFHKDRREYFTSALHEARLIVEDQPGLLGPKLDRMLQLISHTYDAIYTWFVHFNCDTFKSKKSSSDLFDANVFSSIYEVIQTTELIFKYENVIRRYYATFIAQYDLAAIEHIFTTLRQAGTVQIDDTDSKYFNGFSQLCNKIKESSANVDSINDSFDDMLLAMMLDWLRIQSRSVLVSKNVCDHANSCCILNNMSYHCQILFDLKLLTETVSPLYNLWYFPSVMDVLMRSSIVFPSSWQYISVAFGIYHDFEFNVLHLHPAERAIAADMCFQHSDESLNFIVQLCANAFLEFWKEYKELIKNQNISTSVNIWLKRFAENKVNVSGKLKIAPFELPGFETQQILRNETNTIVRNFNMLSDFCHSLCEFKCLKILDRTIFTRQALLPHIESFIRDEVSNLMKVADSAADKSTIPVPIRPSVFFEYLSSIEQAVYLLGNMIDLNLECFYYSILLSMSMPKDISNQLSISSFYASWFTDVFLEGDFYNGVTLYSPIRRCFISKSSSAFRADELTDVGEMRSISKIVGFIGVKHITNTLNSHIASSLNLIKKFIANISVPNFESALNSSQSMDSFFKSNRAADEAICTLIKIGGAFILKSSLCEALADTLDSVSPFTNLALQFQSQKRLTREEVMPKMLNSLGFDTELDFELSDRLFESVFTSDTDKSLWTENFIYLLPFVIGYIGARDECEYLSQVEAYTNNAHLIIVAFKRLIPLILYHYRFLGAKEIRIGVQDAALLFAKVAMRISNGTLFTQPIKNKEIYFALINKFTRDNVFLSESTTEQIIPSCLLTSANDKMIRSKLIARRGRV